MPWPNEPEPAGIPSSVVASARPTSAFSSVRRKASSRCSRKSRRRDAFRGAKRADQIEGAAFQRPFPFGKIGSDTTFCDLSACRRDARATLAALDVRYQNAPLTVFVADAVRVLRQALRRSPAHLSQERRYTAARSELL